jgi:hypothetical protein
MSLMPVRNLFVFNTRPAGQNMGAEEHPYFFTGSTVPCYPDAVGQHKWSVRLVHGDWWCYYGGAAGDSSHATLFEKRTF